MDFSAAVLRVSHCGLLYKLRSIGVEGQLLFIVSEFLSDRYQRVRLEGNVRAPVDVVSSVPQDSVLEPLLFYLFTLYISELFHTVGNHFVDYANNTTISTVIPRPLSRRQVVEALNGDLVAIHCWCLK